MLTICGTTCKHAPIACALLLDCNEPASTVAEVQEQSKYLVQGAVVIEYFYYQELDWHFNHRWAHEILKDSGLPVQLIAVTNTDPAFVQWDHQVVHAQAFSQMHAHKANSLHIDEQHSCFILSCKLDGRCTFDYVHGPM